MDDYKPVIGLEIHVELKTKSKMFCQCDAGYFGKKPNTNICQVCLGLPGALPVPNKKAIEWTQLIGAALNCQINLQSKFDRKHYSYPDLPKGYQISQYDNPLCSEGYLEIISHPTGGRSKKFRIQRVHLEEDTGKLIHLGNDTLVDFNRSGVPLVEIVTEPDFDNADDVKKFLEELHVIIRYLGVSNADMEKGSMRLEPNISLRKTEEKELPKYKVEIKNINSFKFVSQAIEYELERQKEILDKGGTPEQETRGFDEKKQITYSQRSKEAAHDYRYFPEPDIPPMTFLADDINKIKVPELPQQKIKKYIKEFGLKQQDAQVLTRDWKKASDFEKAIKAHNEISPQAIANLIINKNITGNFAQELSPRKTDVGLLDAVVLRVINANKKVIEDYKSGKTNAIMFLVGQVMREMKGQADAKLVRETLEKKLKEG